MHSRLRSSSLRVRTCCYDRAFSSATIVAQGVSRGCRSIVSGSFYLIHECYTTCSGDYRRKVLERMVGEIRRCNEILVGIYVDNGCSREKVEELLGLNDGEGDLLLAQEALSYGLVDEVIPWVPTSVVFRSPRSRWDVIKLRCLYLWRKLFI